MTPSLTWPFSIVAATLLQTVVAGILATAMAPLQQVAVVHTLFNLAAALIALPLVPSFWPRLEGWLKNGETP